MRRVPEILSAAAVLALGLAAAPAASAGNFIQALSGGCTPGPESVLYQEQAGAIAVPNASASWSLKPHAYLENSASAPTACTVAAAAGFYEFQVGITGPFDPNVSIGLNADYKLSISGTGVGPDSYAVANAHTYIEGYDFFDLSQNVANGGSFSQSVDETRHMFVHPGQVLTVVIQISAQAFSSFDSGSAQAYAFADPYFHFDPDVTGYGLILPDGMDNTPFAGGAVPEPAAWALMIAGFGLAGAALRRRRALA